MKIKALTSFCGAVSMFAGEVREVADEVARDLINAGHAASYEADKKGAKPVKRAKAPESVEDAEVAEEPVEGKKTSKKTK